MPPELIEQAREYAPVIVTGVVVMLIVMLMRALSRRARPEAPIERESRAAATRLEVKVEEQKRQIADLKGEERTVGSLALSLPHVVRELNRDDLDVRTVPKLILNLADAIFKPSQMMFYIASPSAERRGETDLKLLRQKGLKEVPDAIKRVPFGEGKLGWVARHKLDKLHDEWATLERNDGVTVRDNHPKLQIDIVGPLLHYTAKGEQVLGVLSIGGLGVRPREEKLMFQLVTNLGSLALINTRNINRLREQANHDGLTGLLNKRFFMFEMSKTMVKIGREAQRMALFIFDIDHFKNYNDTNGHPAGDELLRRLAKLLTETLRPEDWCCRYGGEEFLVAMINTDGAAALAIAEGIRAAIEEFPFEHQEKQPGGNVTISGGVAVYPTDGSSLEELTLHADEALYNSKRGGRNRVARYASLGMGDLEQEVEATATPTPVTQQV